MSGNDLCFNKTDPRRLLPAPPSISLLDPAVIEDEDDGAGGHGDDGAAETVAAAAANKLLFPEAAGRRARARDGKWRLTRNLEKVI